MLAALPLACALILRGDTRALGGCWRSALRWWTQGDVLLVAPLAGQLMQCLAWVEDYATADRLGHRVVDAARNSSAPGVLRLVLAFRSELDFRLGRWSEAYAHATEALRLAREAGSGTELAYSLTCLARMDAAQGRETDCRDHVTEAQEVFADRGIASTLSYGQAALGLLELGLGHVEPAIEQLEMVAALNAEQGLAHPNVIPWRPDLVEAYARAGRREEAEAALVELENEADSRTVTGPTARRRAAGACLPPTRSSSHISPGARGPDGRLGSIRPCSNGALPRRAAPPRESPRRRPEGPSACARRLRAGGSRAVGRAGAGRAEGHRRDGAPPRRLTVAFSSPPRSSRWR